MLKKKVIVFIMATLFLLSGCAGPKATVAIMQIAGHPSLDQVRTGICDVLEEGGFLEGKNLKLNLYNANGDYQQALELGKEISRQKVDLIIAISSQSAKAVLETNKHTPLLFTAVSDPVGAGIIDSIANNNGQVTGVSDMTPVQAQLKLLKTLLPNSKKIAMIYNGEEKYTKIQVEMARQYSAKYDLSLVEKNVKNGNEAILAVKNLLGDIDALYFPTNQTVNSKLSEILAWTNLANKPVFTGEADGVQKGALASVVIDYYQLGAQTGKMAVKILRKERKINQIPVENSQNNRVVINVDTAAALGIEIPFSHKDMQIMNQ